MASCYTKGINAYSHPLHFPPDAVESEGKNGKDKNFGNISDVDICFAVAFVRDFQGEGLI